MIVLLFEFKPKMDPLSGDKIQEKSSSSNRVSAAIEQSSALETVSCDQSEEVFPKIRTASANVIKVSFAANIPRSPKFS